jgi:hypothetical protein
MKQLIFLITLFLVIYQPAFAQPNYEIRQSIEFYDFHRMKGSNLKQGLSESGIKGSPYLNDEFAEGSVYTTSKTQFVGIPLRYNIYNDQVEFKTAEGQVMALALPEVVEKVEIGELLLENVPYFNAKKIKRGFLVVLEKGPASLYVRPRVLFEDAEKPLAYQDAKPARFIRKPDEYFIRLGGEPAKHVSKRKDIDDAFPPDDSRITTYIKNYKIKPDDKESLLALIKYYNSL